MGLIRRCPTKNCTTQPVAGFSYCREHAGSERGQYDALERVERKLEASRQQLRGAVDARAAMTTRLAKILRLTYHEDMPDHLADAIRSLCANPGGQ